MRKKSLLSFLLLLSMVMSFSVCCTDDDEDGDEMNAELTINPTNLEFTALGGTKNVVVSSKLDSWNVIPDATANWCTITKGNGEFIVTVEEFVERIDRKATLKVTSGNESQDFVVIQKAVAADLSPEKEEVSLNGFGTATRVKITASSNEWTATSEETWIRTEKDGEDLVIRATLSSLDRTGKVCLLLNDAKAEITVKQVGTETTIGGVVFGEDGATPIGVIVNNVDSTNCIYVVSLKEEALVFTTEDKFYTFTDSLSTNGQKATACFKEIQGYKEKFPAIAYCDQIEKLTGMKGWYIPGCKEKEIWQALVDNKDKINTTLKALQGNVLMESIADQNTQWGDYRNIWTSTTIHYEADSYVSSMRTKKGDFTDGAVNGGYVYAVRCFLKFEYLKE